MVEAQERPAHERQIIGLDVLRFAAAFMVMFYHFAFCSWASPTSPARLTGGDFDAYRPLEAWSSFGWVGVEIFFVVSGFVIAYSADGASAARFLRSRILRLGPGVWVAATVTLLVALAVNLPEPNLIEAYIRSLLFSPQNPWISGVYWTLWVEIAFYACVFLLLALDQFHRLALFATGLGLVSALFWAVYAAAMLGVDGLSPIMRLANHRIGELLLLQYGCFFALGVFLWLG